MGDLFKALCQLIDTILIIGIVIVLVFVIGVIAYLVISDRKYAKERKEKEELRQRRLKKVPVQNRKCSNCKYGQEKVLSDMIVFYCTNSQIANSNIEETFENGILEKKGCPYFDSQLSSFLN